MMVPWAGWRRVDGGRLPAVDGEESLTALRQRVAGTESELQLVAAAQVETTVLLFIELELGLELEVFELLFRHRVVGRRLVRQDAVLDLPAAGFLGGRARPHLEADAGADEHDRFAVAMVAVRVRGRPGRLTGTNPLDFLGGR